MLKRVFRSMRSFGVLGACLALAATGPAMADETLKVGYLKTYAMLPLFQAVSKGYFKAHGLAVELVVLNNGPAVASALSSGSLDIGYAALLPIIAARAAGEDYKFFAATSYESNDKPITMYVASEKSGVRSFKDVAGKTIAVNASGAGCQLGAEDHTEAAGTALAGVKTIILPFPQMQAALEVGNADVACAVDPFYTAIMQSKKIGARLLATGGVTLPDGKRVMLDGFFAREAWLKASDARAAAFVAAFEEGARDLVAEPALMPKLLVGDLRFSPDIAEVVKIYPVASTAIDPADMQPLIDAMERRKYVTQPVQAADLVYRLKAK